MVRTVESLIQRLQLLARNEIVSNDRDPTLAPIKTPSIKCVLVTEAVSIIRYCYRLISDVYRGIIDRDGHVLGLELGLTSGRTI
jgi:hypothetical protein